jgi:hypothetical protein
VADEHQAAAQAGQLGFQPFDGGEVEMVGGLVQQQQVGRRGQGAGQRGAAGLAAGEGGGAFLAGQAQGAQQGERAVGVVGRAEAGFAIGQRGRRGAEIGLLREVADGDAGLAEHSAFLGLQQVGGNLQQRGLDAAGAAYQAEAVAGADGQFGAIQQGRAAQGQTYVL